MPPRELINQSVFGTFDGVTSLMGVLAGLLVAHASAGAILATSGGLAVASAIGMAFGTLLSGTALLPSTVLGVATLAGSFLPALPVVLLPSPASYLVTGALIVALVIVIAELRDEPRPRAYLLTSATLAIASGCAIGAAVFLGG